MTEPGRTFPARRTVRLGDVTATARVRLDALARYLQDIATDDAADAGLADGWVLRRLELQIDEFPHFRDDVDLVTWCSGFSASAAERRTTVHVDGRPAMGAVALWVFVGADGRPARIDRERFARYGLTIPRRIGTRLRHGDLPSSPEVGGRPWPLRAADVDVLGHVNNAVSLAAAEDLLVHIAAAETPAPWRVEVEYHHAIELAESPELVWARTDDGGVAGALRCAGQIRTTFRLRFPSQPPAPSPPRP